MISQKNSRLLHALSENSRVTTRELSQKLKISQQSASYTLSELEKNKILKYQVICDPSRLGMITILVFFTYTTFNKKTIQDIRKHLRDSPYVTMIEEVSQGMDLMVEYIVPNLSLFNKQYRLFLECFNRSIKMQGIYPVIVKHLYSRSYLDPKKNRMEIIVSGDRESIQLEDTSKKVLYHLQKNARTPIIHIAKKTGLDPKTVVKIKKQLERGKVIRKYSTVLDTQALTIDRTHLFLQLAHEAPEETMRFLAYSKQHPNIVAATKIIGDYELFVTIEKKSAESSLVNELRKTFQISDYQIIHSEQIVERRYIPEAFFE